MPRRTKCFWCRRALLHPTAASELSATRDHVWPKSRGGSTTVPCCRACNNLKGDMLPKQWLAFRAKYPDWIRFYKGTNLRGIRLYAALIEGVSPAPPTDR